VIGKELLGFVQATGKLGALGDVDLVEQTAEIDAVIAHLGGVLDDLAQGPVWTAQGSEREFHRSLL